MSEWRRVTVIINGERQPDIMGRKGKKPKQNVARYPSGQIRHRDRGETETQALSTALWQRQKLGATETNFRSQEWGSPLGQLRMRAKIANSDGEGLSEKQYAAAKRYILARARYRACQGFPPESPKSISADLVPRGIDLSRTDDDEDAIMHLRRDYNGARSAMLSYPGQGQLWQSIMEALARDEHIESQLIGDVRQACNVLARHYGV